MKTRTNQPVTDYDGLLDEVVAQSDSNGIKVFEDIKDKDGNPRFDEGDGTPSELSGYTATYCKWSLSGTHLLLVLAGSLANGTALSSTNLCYYNIPKWIYDKIYPVWQTYIEARSVNYMNDDWTSQTGTITLRKDINNQRLYILSVGSLTTNKERHFRIQFDLLIDNE